MSTERSFGVCGTRSSARCIDLELYDIRDISFVLGRGGVDEIRVSVGESLG